MFLHLFLRGKISLDFEKINQCKNEIYFKPLKPSGHYTYRQIYPSTILRSAHTVYLSVLYGSQNKQPLLSYTTLTDWFL